MTEEPPDWSETNACARASGPCAWEGSRSTSHSPSRVAHHAFTPPATQGEETVISFLLRLAAMSGTLPLCARGYGHPHPTHVVRWMNCRCSMGPHYPAFTVVISLKSKQNIPFWESRDEIWGKSAILFRLEIALLIRRARLHNIPEDSWQRLLSWESLLSIIMYDSSVKGHLMHKASLCLESLAEGWGSFLRLKTCHLWLFHLFLS